MRDSATRLIEPILDAHGGRSLWERSREIRADVSAGGLAFRSRFTGRALRSFEARVSTREPKSRLAPYPTPGLTGHFLPGRVEIRTDGGDVVAARDDPRAAFRSPRHLVWWDDLDTLYFAGYAIWNYLTVPFLLASPGFSLRDAGTWGEDGNTWRKVDVSFPPGTPTHSRDQTFYFDDSWRLRRLDYTAAPFGSWAKAAHYCDRHRRFDGLLVPTRRRVYARRPSGRPLWLATLVGIEIASVSLS